MTTEYLLNRELGHVLAALTSSNALVMRVCLHTGLRLGDVLALRTPDLLPGPRLQFWVREQKTGKRRRVNLTRALAEEMAANAGEIWIFEGASDPTKHRTRQAVWADVKRAAKAFRLPQNVAPHSIRKVYAVELMRKYHDVKRVQRALNHSNPAVTLIYAMADKLYTAKYGGG